MPRYLNRKLGVVVRDVSFFDLYNRKLSQKQKGVVVSLIRTGAPAGLGNTPLQSGYIITRIDNRKVANVGQFAKMVSADMKKPNARSLVFEVINGSGDTAVCHIRLH
jgi:S1-C subfamily serine protease